MAASTFLLRLSALATLPLIFAGCATTPVTYRLHETAITRVPVEQRVVVAPIDAELAELTVGGMLEPREEWTKAAAENITSALAAETGYHATPTDAPATLVHERQEVQALMRAFTVSRGPLIVGAAPMFPTQNGDKLTFNTGPLSLHGDLLQADAVLFVFIRDSYATAGRKSLLALSFIGAALTGVAVIPAMGSTAVSAALVNRDGTVLWFNHSPGGSDPRTPEGAKTLVHGLLAGLPRAQPRT